MIPRITVHLLDSAHGHPLQTWMFENRDSVTLGRSPDNDIVVSDPHVSRAHAYLKFDRDEWRLIAISRQLIFYEGHSWPEVPVDDGMVCRLGPQGCSLRFGQAEAQQHQRATLPVGATFVPNLQLDREKLQQDVCEIVDAPYFQQLTDAMRRRRAQRQLEETKL